jgi:protein tyrosine/serine phosphatase
LRIRRPVLVGCAITAALVAGGVWAWWQFLRPYHFHTVEPGVLYRSGTQPNEYTLRSVLDASGARTIVILRKADERADRGDPWFERETRVAAERGVAVRHIPMEFDTPPTAAQLDEFLRIVDDAAARPVLVHCEVGVIRTGMMVAAWRMARQGMPPADACREYEDIAGRHAENPKRAHVREWILGFPASASASAPASPTGR